MENKKNLKKTQIILIIFLLLVIVTVTILYIYNTVNIKEYSGNNQIQDSLENNNSSNIDSNNNNMENTQKGEDLSMKIKLDNKEYEVKLDNNATTKEIVSNMSLNLNMMKYAEHEYYSELPFRPVMDENKTSEIKAGHIYYWDGWNAFVINYIDYDITPYKVVHIGEIVDKSIVDILLNAQDEIQIEVIE